MEWTGVKSNKNVRLPDDLHNAVKAAAATRGVTVESAYEEGMTRWLKPTSPFGEITKEEERLLLAVLRYWREAPEEELKQYVLRPLAKEWGAKKA